MSVDGLLGGVIPFFFFFFDWMAAANEWSTTKTTGLGGVVKTGDWTRTQEGENNRKERTKGKDGESLWEREKGVGRGWKFRGGERSNAV